MISGYLHPNYAKSFMEFGDPYKLPRCGGWIIKRQVPGFPCFDAMGCYPVFICQDWSQIHKDLGDKGTDLSADGRLELLLFIFVSLFFIKLNI